MSGTLGLPTPWTRQAVQDPLRSELRALIPDGWTIGLKVDRGPDRPGARYGAWANDDRSGASMVYTASGMNPEKLIRHVIAWIHDNETWTLGYLDAG